MKPGSLCNGRAQLSSARTKGLELLFMVLRSLMREGKNLKQTRKRVIEEAACCLVGSDLQPLKKNNIVWWAVIFNSMNHTYETAVEYVACTERKMLWVELSQLPLH